MNAAFLIMSSAALAGADPAPPPSPPAAPVVVSTGAGCNTCAPSGCCGKNKPGLLDRIKSRLGGLGSRRNNSCGCAPACAPAPQPCNACPNTCDRPNLLDKIRSSWGGFKSKKRGPSCCDPCAVQAPVHQHPDTGTPPKEMPKPKDKTDGNTSIAPVPFSTVPTVPAAGTSPY